MIREKVCKTGKKVLCQLISQEEGADCIIELTSCCIFSKQSRDKTCESVFSEIEKGVGERQSVKKSICISSEKGISRDLESLVMSFL